MSLLWTFSRQSFIKLSMYRMNFWTDMFALFIQIYVVTVLWKVLYTQSPSSFSGVSQTQMITYAVMGLVLGVILTTDQGPHHYLTQQIKSGSITNDILKPIDFPLHMLLRTAGDAVSTGVFYVLPSFLVSLFVFDFSHPTGFIQTIGLFVSVLLSFMILFFCNFLFGLISFKTLDLVGFFFTYWALLRFLSGQLIPIWLYPAWMVPFIQALPFQSIFNTPLSIFIGKIQGADLYHAIFWQMIWVIVLYVIVRWVWSRIYSHLVVQGG